MSDKINYFISRIEPIDVYISVFFGVVWSFILPVYPFLILSLILIIFDQYTGKKAAKKKGETITPDGFGKSIDKSLIYFALILILEGVKNVFFASTGIPYLEDFPITYVGAILIVKKEMMSISNHVYILTGVELWQYLSRYFTIKK